MESSKRPYSQRKKVAVSVMLFAVLMQLVMQRCLYMHSIQIRFWQNADSEVSIMERAKQLLLKQADGIRICSGVRKS